ncbi:MAG TPA: tail protein X [Candidatus Binataceae bacterium]|nr:tail protein X [Candidatus Binataceae bacterium]
MTAQQYIAHLTRAGERWDLLAWSYYGDATRFNPIIMANPAVPIEPVFEAGILIQVPVLSANNSATADLPPWKSAAVAGNAGNPS